MADAFLDRVRKYPDLISSAMRRDVVFRHRFEGSSNKMPFQIGYFEEELKNTYEKLEAGQIDEADALDEITSVMERYYEMPYPLD